MGASPGTAPERELSQLAAGASVGKWLKKITAQGTSANAAAWDKPRSATLPDLVQGQCRDTPR